MKSALGGLALLVVLLAGSTYCHDRNLEVLPQKSDYLGYMVLPSLSQMRVMSLGYQDVVADGLYIFLIQNYTIIPKEQRAQKTFDIADMAGQLKGDNPAPYVMSFIFLANSLKERELAYQLADLGIERMPTDTQVPFVALTEAALLERNQVRARHYAEILLDRDPTNYFAERLHARSLVAAGDLDASLQLWHSIKVDAEAGNRPNTEFYLMLADKNIHDLTIRIQCKELTALAREYTDFTGKTVQSLQQLVDEGVLEFIPLDPAGKPYQWNAAQEEAVSASPYKFKAASSW